jgi:hypothetical protein
MKRKQTDFEVEQMTKKQMKEESMMVCMDVEMQPPSLMDSMTFQWNIEVPFPLYKSISTPLDPSQMQLVPYKRLDTHH